VILLAVSLAACGGSQGGCKPPLERLEPTAAATLGPGNETGQDEDPNLFVTRRPDALCAALYSNRLGVHPDGLARREIFVTRSLDGETWSEPVAATDSHAWRTTSTRAPRRWSPPPPTGWSGPHRS
jgi:hypothetical protein